LPSTKIDKTAKLTLVKGGRSGFPEFTVLPFAEKLSYLQGAAPKERLDLILADPEGKRLTRAMEPQELFWLIKEIGETDAIELLAMAAPEQCIFLLDMEIWNGWTFSEEKAVEWFGYLLAGGEERFQELLPQLDFGLLTLFLGRELIVGGGIGELNTDDERLTDWDHTFDDVFMLKFRNSQHAATIGAFLELVCRTDNELYTALMESVRSDIDVEQEEECQRFRSGRLADLGFPPLDEALAIYSRLDPANFTVSGGKELQPGNSVATLPVPYFGDNSLLQKALALANSAELQLELNCLINTALVADAAPFADAEAMKAVMQRVFGYLNIALEHLAGGDVAKAAAIIADEYLKRLFRLGFSIVLSLKGKAAELSGEGYTAGKALAGLKLKRPRFYRGFDPDGIDGYREFRNLADVRRVEEFLAQL
jgi:hypothetical protein